MDMNQYLDLFLEEATEHVQNLNHSLLNLENNPERIDILDEIFRASHTLKGMSATMGYDSIAQLTHKLENLLDKLRVRKIVLNAEIFNVLFQAADVLEIMLDSIRSGEKIKPLPEDLLARLAALDSEPAKMKGQQDRNPGNSGEEKQDRNKEEPAVAEIKIPDEFNEYERNIIVAATEKGLNVLKLEIEIDDGCLMKGVRAFMVFKALEGDGEIFKAFPSIQDIEDENFENSFLLYYITSEPVESVRGKLASISEIKIKNTEKIAAAKEFTLQEAAETREQQDEKPQQAEKRQKIHQTVRVDTSRLDKLMSLVGELVINKTRLEQINISNQLTDLNETIEQINRITTDLQTVVQNVRMVAIEQVFNRFPRMVRDLAKELGKDVDLILEGKETELDRTVIDELGDPLVHLIRNSIGHGLESPQERRALGKPEEGMLKLSAKQEGNQVIICVEDDGKGIDVEAIKQKAVKNGLFTESALEQMEGHALLNLIFEPGFSTAREVTDLSGRGVGLDVVRSKIQSLSGQVYVETKKGLGTRFVIKLPLTLAIIQALLVKVGDETYAIPLGNIDETTSLEPELIKNVQDRQVMLLRGKVLPLFFLKKILQVSRSNSEGEMYVVVVRKGDQQVGLVSDELIGQQEIVINSLGKLLAGIPGIAGASILGDGRVSLILDIATLL